HGLSESHTHHIILCCTPALNVFIFFNDTATTEIYTLSLHDALPIYKSPQATLLFAGAFTRPSAASGGVPPVCPRRGKRKRGGSKDRKSTRLNSSHVSISYAVFCLKKKKERARSLERVQRCDDG